MFLWFVAKKPKEVVTVSKSERILNPEKLIQTSDELTSWIAKTFPDAHLSSVAQGVRELTAEAVQKAEMIRRPVWFLRIPIIILAALLVAGAAHQVYTHQLKEVLKFLDDTKGASVYIMTGIAVFITLEIRWKRRKAIQAVNELRAMAHLIDMHQLTKDQVIEEFHDNHGTPEIEQYLHACTALLSLVSKLGQLYVQHFPDNVAVNSVNAFEAVTSGLSNEIWMKILSLRKPPSKWQGGV